MLEGLSRWHVTMCGHVTGSHVINPYLSIIKAQDERKRLGDSRRRRDPVSLRSRETR